MEPSAIEEELQKDDDDDDDDDEEYEYEDEDEDEIEPESPEAGRLYIGHLPYAITSSENNGRFLVHWNLAGWDLKNTVDGKFNRDELTLLGSGACTMFALHFASQLISQHLYYWKRPKEQRAIIIIALMAPVYAMNSFVGFVLSEDEDLDGFYKNFVQSRINGVKLGDKCTIMMYGPTGSGKSHTMFRCAKKQGIVYKSLRDILGNRVQKEVGVGTFVQVTVLEIYNEEIYDMLSTNTTTSNVAGFTIGWSRSNASKVKLEVMGKKEKNATFISGTEAGKISKEIQKVEKRKILKSIFCNERSSRSHCMENGKLEEYKLVSEGINEAQLAGESFLEVK
ncbi:hypothetical protein L6452_42729 [Arctium lappa]|uniref:Uncharacterized protein n=1 Tax=Arctium lappa TaxID=4217 RepID=A0ACB8XJF4_ARCLA|nr:hypothetical protein L6452_42729 [Arctium lappa]